MSPIEGRRAPDKRKRRRIDARARGYGAGLFAKRSPPWSRQNVPLEVPRQNKALKANSRRVNKQPASPWRPDVRHSLLSMRLLPLRRLTPVTSPKRSEHGSSPIIIIISLLTRCPKQSARFREWGSGSLAEACWEENRGRHQLHASHNSAEI
jgi:hypothetical protein